MAQKLGCWDLVNAVLPLATRLLLYGPPGTGKTWQGLTGGLRSAQEVFSITLTEDTPAAELRGHYVPVDGRFVWRDGPALAAWRAGARLVVNELDHASGDVLTFLLAILDDHEMARVTLPTNETVRPADGFSVVATMNGDPDTLPAPLRDRFPIALEVNAVHPGALQALNPDIQKAARDTVALPAERRISIRAWQAFGQLRPALGEELATRVVFGQRAGDVLDALKLARG